MRARVCALVSGGLDSCVLLAELTRRGQRVWPVFIRQGLIWETAELRHLRRFLRLTPALARCEALTVLTLPATDLYARHWSTTGRSVPHARTPDAAVYLPGRNLLLLAKAAVFCAQHGIPTIAIGTLARNPFADATPRFFRDFARVAGPALGQSLRVIAPFRALAKADVLRRGRNLPLHLSFSCLAPRRAHHCGRCNKCAERRLAFRAAGIPDRTRYG